MIACIFLLFYLYFIYYFLYFTSAVLSDLDIIILLKQLLFIYHKLISVSLLDWSEVGLLL